MENIYCEIARYELQSVLYQNKFNYMFHGLSEAPLGIKKVGLSLSRFSCLVEKGQILSKMCWANVIGFWEKIIYIHQVRMYDKISWNRVRQASGADAKASRGMPVCYTGVICSCSCCSTADPASCSHASWEVVDDSLSTCIAAIQAWDPNGVLDFWFESGSVLAFMGRWGVNRHMEDLCFSLSLNKMTE